MKKGKLYTSYFAKLKYGKGLKISIARYNPKWLSNKYIDKWFQELAPNRYLLDKYKYKNLSWEEYEELYKKDLFNYNTSRMQLDELKYLLDKGQDVTVYCYEKPSDNCHRHILANIISNLGYETEEIKFE